MKVPLTCLKEYGRKLLNEKLVMLPPSIPMLHQEFAPLQQRATKQQEYQPGLLRLLQLTDCVEAVA